MKTAYLALFAASSFVNADVLYGTFQFTSNGVTNEGIVWEPELVENPAFFIFDTDTQSLKVFNFMEQHLDDDIFSHDYHQYEVSRHSGDSPITSISELTDFSVVQWRHYEETELYPDWPYYVEIITDTEGRFSYYEPGGLGQSFFGSGEILSFSLNQREEGKNESWSFEIEARRIWFKLDTKVGYKYEVFGGSELSALSLISLSAREQSNDGMLIGTGEDWFLIEREKNNQYFMKATAHPLLITD